VVKECSEGKPQGGEEGPQGDAGAQRRVAAALFGNGVLNLFAECRSCTQPNITKRSVNGAAFWAHPAMLCEFLIGSEPV
jgi:hypothetical protein